MNYELKLNDRPFQAIKIGTKKIEGRTPKDKNDDRYQKMKHGDVITFINTVTGKKMNCLVDSVIKYPDVRVMLENEGVENVLSSGLDIEGGIKSYHSIENNEYEKRIKKHGIYAIRINPNYSLD